MSSTTALVSLDDIRLAQVPLDERRRARELHQVMEGIRAAGKPITKAFATVAANLGCSVSRVANLYYRWLQQPSWEVLVDHRTTKASAALPPEFVSYWKALQLDYQRDTAGRAAWQELVKRWHAGEEIPGYPAGPRHSLPRGWSYRNLIRSAYRPDKYACAAVRQGRNAARLLLPAILTTRVGVEVGRVFEYDDQEYDTGFVHVAATGIIYATGFNCLDFSSGHEVLPSFKPMIADATLARRKLNQDDFEWYQTLHLLTVGWHPEGSRFVHERGTTKLGKAYTERLLTLTKGAVEIWTGGLHNAPAVPGEYAGAAKGNPRFKARREGFFRLLRERLSNLPGARGITHDRAPESHYHGLQQHVAQLTKQAAELPPELAAQVEYPLLTFDAFVAAALETYREIGETYDHRLEGWEQMGRMVREFRFAVSAPWMSWHMLEALEPAQRDAVRALLETSAELQRVRRMSRREAWDAGAAKLVRLQPRDLPELLGEERGRVVTVRDDLTMQVQDVDIEPDPMFFLGVLSSGRQLERGQKVMAFLNPFNPSRLEICDAKLRWLGSAPRQQRICKLDADTQRQELGRWRKLESAALAGVAGLRNRFSQDAIERSRNNAAVLGGNTPRQKAARARHNDRSQEAEDILTRKAAAAFTTPHPQTLENYGNGNDTDNDCY